MGSELDRAVALLGPLEGRIMRLVWTAAVTDAGTGDVAGGVSGEFVVRDIQQYLPDLAYTTVMTTLRRLADKGLLVAEARLGRRAHAYRAAGTPAHFLATASHRETEDIIARYGDAALAAFAARLDTLTSEQRRRLRDLATDTGTGP